MNGRKRKRKKIFANLNDTHPNLIPVYFFLGLNAFRFLSLENKMERENREIPTTDTLLLQILLWLLLQVLQPLIDTQFTCNYMDGSYRFLSYVIMFCNHHNNNNWIQIPSSTEKMLRWYGIMYQLPLRSILLRYDRYHSIYSINQFIIVLMLLNCCLLLQIDLLSYGRKWEEHIRLLRFSTCRNSTGKWNATISK